jgi:hypothetical protein
MPGEAWLEAEVRYLSIYSVKQKPCLRKLDHDYNSNYIGKSYFFRGLLTSKPHTSAAGNLLCPFSDHDNEASVTCAASSVASITSADSGSVLWFGMICFAKDQRATTVFKRVKALFVNSSFQVFVLGSPFQIWALFNVLNARRIEDFL